MCEMFLMPDDPLVRLELDDAVDQQERVPVRQDALDGGVVDRKRDGLVHGVVSVADGAAVEARVGRAEAHPGLRVHVDGVHVAHVALHADLVSHGLEVP